MTNVPHEPEPNDRRMKVIYVLVVAVEVAVITALWGFSRYFS